MVNIYITVHGRLKLENRNWKLDLYGFELLMNVFNFRPASCHLVPRLCLGILYTEALPHKQVLQSKACNKNKVGVSPFKTLNIELLLFNLEPLNP